MEEETTIVLSAELAAVLGTPELKVYYLELHGGAIVTGARRPSGAVVQLTNEQRAAIERLVAARCAETPAAAPRVRSARDAGRATPWTRNTCGTLASSRRAMRNQ